MHILRLSCTYKQTIQPSQENRKPQPNNREHSCEQHSNSIGCFVSDMPDQEASERNNQNVKGFFSICLQIMIRV